jgi:hypothetical protein
VCSERVWCGFIWLRIGQVAGFLTWELVFLIYWEFFSREELLAYQEVFCSMERLKRYKPSHWVFPYVVFEVRRANRDGGVESRQSGRV